MNKLQRREVKAWIESEHARNGNFPSHKQILLKMLQVADEVTYLDAVEYGLGATFRSRLSDLRKEHSIVSMDRTVSTRYGVETQVKAHKLVVAL